MAEVVAAAAAVHAPQLLSRRLASSARQVADLERQRLQRT